MESPPLHSWNRQLYVAFQQLTGSRQVTMAGAATIPISEILIYLSWSGITGQDAEDWLHLLQELDAAYLAEINNRKD